MINQEFKAQGTKYQVLPNFGICCRKLGELKVLSFRACVRSFCSVSVDVSIREIYSLYLPGLDGLRIRAQVSEEEEDTNT